MIGLASQCLSIHLEAGRVHECPELRGGDLEAADVERRNIDRSLPAFVVERQRIEAGVGAHDEGPAWDLDEAEELLVWQRPGIGAESWWLRLAVCRRPRCSAAAADLEVGRRLPCERLRQPRRDDQHQTGEDFHLPAREILSHANVQP